MLWHPLSLRQLRGDRARVRSRVEGGGSRSPSARASANTNWAREGRGGKASERYDWTWAWASGMGWCGRAFGRNEQQAVRRKRVASADGMSKQGWWRRWVERSSRVWAQAGAVDGAGTYPMDP